MLWPGCRSIPSITINQNKTDSIAKMKNKRYIFLCLLVSLCTTLSAQKAFRPIKDNLKAKKPAEAMKHVEKLSKDSTFMHDARLYAYGVECSVMQNSQINEKIYLKQKYDTLQFFKSIYDVYTYIMRCDQEEAKDIQTPKQKYKYRKGHQKLLFDYMPNLNAGGRYLYSKGKYKEALEYLDLYLSVPRKEIWGQDTSIIRSKTYIDNAYFALNAAFKLKNYTGLSKYLDIALRDSLNHERIFEIQARTAEALNDTARFRSILFDAVRRFPRNFFFYSHLIDLLNTNKEYETSLSLASTLLRLDSNNVYLLEAESSSLLSLKQYKKAIASAERCLAADPEYTDAHYYIGMGYYNQGNLITLPASIRNKNYKKLSNEQKEYFNKALPHLEKYRKAYPEQIQRWAAPLYKIYLILNKGEEFEEIEKLLTKNDIAQIEKEEMNPKTENTPYININKMNPFLQTYDTPHHTFPFDLIKTEHIEPALYEAMETEKQEIENIVRNSDAPTFENTIVAYENAGRLLEEVTTYLHNQLSANTNDELEELATRILPVLADHAADITQNEALFERVRNVYQQNLNLNDEDRMLLEKTYIGFKRSGALLNKTDKDKLKEINKRLSSLTLQFSQNHLKETNNFYLHITDKTQLDGLPELQISQAKQAAEEKGVEGWAITLHAPSYVPFMMYAKNRELRQKLYMAYNTQCTHDNEYNNYTIVKEIVNLRHDMAKLLGYNTYSDYVLERRMAEKPENIYKMIDKLIANYKEPAQKELQALEELAKEQEGSDFTLMPWDISYFSQHLKKKMFDIDQEMLRPYFKLENVKKGVFGLANRMYGITLKKSKDIPVYNPDVEAYEVFDKNGEYLAVLYTDFFPRSNKRSGAWMTNYKEQWKEKNGINSRPHVSLNTNFTPPTVQQESLLTLDEVSTFLHEFGHCLHSIFANSTYESLAGTNVYWDFVELPSQFMENYATEKEFLRTFAFHHKTGEVIPDSLVDKIVDSRNFNAGYACMRQLSFCLLDMAYYDRTEPFDEDVRTFEHKAWERAQISRQIDETCMSVQFGHIMEGGYASGYYSYKWAEVLDADAFETFKETGIFNTETAQRFRDCILSRGGTQHPSKLYLDFKGKAPSIDALLRRNGLK